MLCKPAHPHGPLERMSYWGEVASDEELNEKFEAKAAKMDAKTEALFRESEEFKSAYMGYVYRRTGGICTIL